MPKVNKTAVCRRCRRAGEKLFLKGEKCLSPKCLIIKRNYCPGVHGVSKRPRRLTGYGEQLKEKQKAKRVYGLSERQFSNYVRKASRQKGNTAESLLKFLELRLDNVIYRLGLSKSRPMARQAVSHGHFLVNGRKVNIPSYGLKSNQEISLRQKSLEKGKLFDYLWQAAGKKDIPSWLSLELDKATRRLTAKVLSFPKIKEMTVEFDPKKIIEFYSR
ncbi:MAG: 30S ribosomal protein S4 [Candidatus Magasanikbacteria bacterium]|nr:30S ribosomal protein S4 [Candidatus Magasanikbacteria bacterium]